MRIKKISKKFLILLFVMLFGGIGGIIINRFIFPRLAAQKFFSHYEFLKKSAENTTLINKTEQVFIKEDTSVSKIAGQTTSSVVGIISFSNQTEKTISSKQKLVQNEPKIGTGVIATSDGMILTYASAINLENSKYKVLISDGNLYDANLVGVDSFSNLAFLKISASNLSAVSFANSDEENAGEKVLAIGYGSENYPFAYNSGLIGSIENNFSVSGKNLASSESLQGVFKMDFNPEQSFIGGPVANYAGQVIGIIGANKIESENNFFILPSNKAKKIIEKAIRGELSNNPVLGIYFVPLSRDYAIQNGLNNQKGALIFSVSGQRGLAIMANSSADKAGLQLGDIITKINNDEIDETHSLPDLLYQYKKGDKINLTIIRAGQESVKEVQL